MQPYSTIPQRSSDAAHIRVLTCNIYCTNADWSLRQRVLREGLAALDPDIVALQEVMTERDGSEDQARAILGADWTIVHSRDRQGSDFGIAIASRWPIGDVEEVNLHLTARTTDFACTALLARIEGPAEFGSILIANHLPDYKPGHEHEREVQTVAVARRIEELVAAEVAHVVLLGDLDAEPDAASLRFLCGRQSLDGTSVCYRNAWESVHGREPVETFSPRNRLMAEANWDWPFRHIDHILVRCSDHGQPTLAIDACELAFAEEVNGIWASDHVGLVADLTVPPPISPDEET